MTVLAFIRSSLLYSLLTGAPPPPPPSGTELLLNRGFESGAVIWTATAGSLIFVTFVFLCGKGAERESIFLPEATCQKNVSVIGCDQSTLKAG